MKRILDIKRTVNSSDIGLLIARLGMAALMLTHGIPKLTMLFSGAPVQFPSVMGMSPELSLSLAMSAEVICSLLLIVGLATRLAVIPLIITMLVAIIFIHAPDPFSQQEPALLYLLVYIVLLFAGAGKYSIDYLLRGKKAGTVDTGKVIRNPGLAPY